MKNLNVLFITTSHDQLGATNHKTGVWLEELATPYYVFKDAGAAITIASPKGGQVPLDPKSEEPDSVTPSAERFKKDHEGIQQLSASLKIKDVKADDFDLAFLPGGHGPMWDLADNTELKELLENFYKQNKPIGSVCHGVAGLVSLRKPNGDPMIKGKKLTSFTNSEEELVGLTNVVPFLLETELLDLGADYRKGDDFAPFAQQDGLIFTGQNPASSDLVASAMLKSFKD
ncbi:type 1 glutamine amidotransferase domain-containing protein [Solitalea sp. MAHUQ-68]|uniref:Type 1 glutamine amidotransferase domain-containing protein n=1 Tax=Solitalea agri TaxID=2953739 RepID=A0A9X2JCC3_9SPHI|nr:type 1 glutamine amidotransferase domain-containing protein [Solitalea agri]MCO4292898.1 type 1 glutamine amidotransferase domain-containing protein [Solitalea agri]